MKVIPLYKNEKQLLAKASKKHRGAQEQLFRKYSGKMLGVCRRYIPDIQQSEEVMLTGFFKAFKNLEDFRNEGSFEGWLRRIMVRESISFLRSKSRIQFVEEIADEENFCNIESDMDVAHIQRLIDALPEGYRMVFVMYAIEGYKHKEIAKILNISTGTSKSQLSKARNILQKQLETVNKSGYGTT